MRERSNNGASNRRSRTIIPANMRRFLPILVLCSCAVLAQEQNKQTVPTFTTKTELVNVPVVVLRAHNPMRQLDPRSWIDEHVTGLSKDDFQLMEDGKRVSIASFEEIRSSSSVERAINVPPGVSTNEVTVRGPVAMMVIVIDTINTPYQYQENTKKKILEFLEHDYRGDRPTMLVALRPEGLKVLHEFTTDPQVLSTIVRKITGNLEHDPTHDNQVMTVNDNRVGDYIDVQAEALAVEKEFMGDLSLSQQAARNIQIDRLATTLYEMQQLAQALSAVQGMKTLIWATGGVVLPLPNPTETKAAQGIDDYVRLLKLMTAAGVSIYPIDVMPEVYNPGYSSAQYRGARPSRIPITPNSQTVQGVQNLMDIAKRTGGDYCLLRKDYDWCFRKAADYGAHYYLLSYYTHTSEKPQWRQIHVNVRGEHLDVKARTGFYAGSRQGNLEERRKADIAQAVTGPVDFRGLAISMHWKDSKKPEQEIQNPTVTEGQPKLTTRPVRRPFVLQVDPTAISVAAADRNHMELDVVAITTDAKGAVLSDVTQHLDLHPNDVDLEKMRRSVFAYTNAIAIPEKATKVKFIVRDDLNERLGTLTVPVP